MSIPVQCNGCHKQFKVRNHLAGKRVRCPWCSMRLSVPVSDDHDTPPPEPPPPKDASRPDSEPVTGAYRVCPFCAERVRAQALKCRFCGEDMPALPQSGMKEGTVSLWEALTEGELAAIEQEPVRRGEQEEGSPRKRRARSPAERRSRRRVKKYLRELARLGKWARVSEFAEVRKVVETARQKLLTRLNGVIEEAKKNGAIQEQVTWDGEVRYRFTGEEDTWPLPLNCG